MPEILFNPIAQPASLAINVPRSVPDEGQPADEGERHYLAEHLLQTRERVLKLQGAFRGLRGLSSAEPTSGSDQRTAVGPGANLDFHTRLITVNDGESSEPRPKGLSLNLLV